MPSETSASARHAAGHSFVSPPPSVREGQKHLRPHGDTVERLAAMAGCSATSLNRSTWQSRHTNARCFLYRSSLRQGTTVEWPEQLSPFVTVARLRLPQQDISGQDNLEKMDALSFTPWRVTAEHAPLGNIMRARKEVYRQSFIERHKLNRQPRTEPRSADEVFDPAHLL